MKDVDEGVYTVTEPEYTTGAEITKREGVRLIMQGVKEFAFQHRINPRLFKSFVVVDLPDSDEHEIWGNSETLILFNDSKLVRVV